MSENKNLDGIKKLSKEEIKKARKILLDYLGEDSNIKKKEKAEKSKNMDGILSGINFKKREARQKKGKKSLENFQKEREVLKKELGFKNKEKADKKEKNNSIVDKNIGGAFLRMAEKNEKKIQQARHREKIKEKNKAIELEEEKKGLVKKELEQKRKAILEEKSKKEEEAKKTAKIKEELEKEKKHLEKLKKEEEEKRKRKKEEEEFATKKKKENDKKERKKKRKKKFKLYKHKIYKKSTNTWHEIKQRKKKIIISILLLVISAFLIYLLFVLLLIKINPDNKATRMIAQYVPVPALISSVGVVEYYDYEDKKSLFNSEFRTIDNKSLNKIFALDFILNSLIKKYEINYNDKDFKQKIDKSIMLDLDINNVGIKRIQKIKDLIDKGESFVQVSNKYGDRVDKIDFENEQSAIKKFGSKLAGLKIDQVSNIIAYDGGYYIFKRYKKDSKFALSYVYISSVSLDDYLNKEASKLKIWSLVD